MGKSRNLTRPRFYIWDLVRHTWWEDGPPTLTRLSPPDFAESARRLQQLLADHGIVPAANSWLAGEIRNALIDFLGASREHACPPGEPCNHWAERADQLRRAGDLAVIEKIMSSARLAVGASEFGARLRDLARGAHPVTARGDRSRARDIAFELVCAGWLGTYAKDVTLAEPDVLCTYEGARWGVACKIANRRVDQAAKHVKKGAEQIQNSDADAGIVVVRITDVFPHADLDPRPTAEGAYRCFVEPKAVMKLVFEMARPITDQVDREITDGGIEGLTRRYPKFKGVVFVGYTLANLLRGGEPVASLVPIYVQRSAVSPPPLIASKLLDAMGWRM